MARLRLGVVLQIPQPLATRIDGLRQALGDGGLGRIEPHITLVPPVNVHERDLPKAFAAVRAAAGSVEPLALQIGPVDTFVPVNPVAYLRVSGSTPALDALERLRAGCNTGVLERSVEHEFVPHVTVADELSEPRLAAAREVLGSFSAELTIDRVHVLAEQPGRIWSPIADAPLGERTAVVGRGSLPLELSTSGRPDLEAAALLAVAGEPAGLPFAVTARREEQVVAAAWGWTAGPALEIADLVVAPEQRGQGVGRHLLAAVEALAVRRGCTLVATTAPPDGAIGSLLRAVGFVLAPSASEAAPARRRWEHHLAPDPSGTDG